MRAISAFLLFSHQPRETHIVLYHFTLHILFVIRPLDEFLASLPGFKPQSSTGKTISPLSRRHVKIYLCQDKETCQKGLHLCLSPIITKVIRYLCEKRRMSI